MFLALGRGAIGGGRLRSEAFDAARLETQLAAVAAETLTRKEVVRIDAADNVAGRVADLLVARGRVRRIARRQGADAVSRSAARSSARCWR